MNEDRESFDAVAVVRNNKIRVLPAVIHNLRGYGGGVLCGGENAAIQAAAVTSFICSKFCHLNLHSLSRHP